MDHGEIEHGSQPGRRGGLARPRHSVEQDAAGGAEILHGGGGHASRLPEVSLSADSTFSQDRKSTRLNSSHVAISYAVFCLKKKKQKYKETQNGSDHRSTSPTGD